MVRSVIAFLIRAHLFAVQRGLLFGSWFSFWIAFLICWKEYIIPGENGNLELFYSRLPLDQIVDTPALIFAAKSFASAP